MVKVSVVIASRNRLQHLSACLRAIAAQDKDIAVEICLVNDGGVSVRPVVEAHPQLDIKFWDSPNNLGQVGARNAALAMAEGDFIALCDDDDRWLPTHLAELLAAAAGQERAFVFTDTELVWIQRGPNGIRTNRRAQFAWRDARELLRLYNPIAPSSVLYSRKLHDDIGQFDPEVGHYWDWDFWLRAAAVTDLTRVPRCETLYGIDTAGTNQSADPERMRPYLRRLIEKHQLGNLPSSNFERMLEDPFLKPYRAESTTVWDGGAEIWNGKEGVANG